MAYEVPLYILWQRFVFATQLLNNILAKHPLACTVGRQDFITGVILGHCHKNDIGRQSVFNLDKSLNNTAHQSIFA
jgi:hypothetical protein